MSVLKEIDGKTDESKEKVNNELTDLERAEDLLGIKSGEAIESSGVGEYVPGSLTSPEHRHESQELLEAAAAARAGNPHEDPTDRFWRKVAERAQHEPTPDMKHTAKTLKLPAVDVSQNFHFAKRMHVGNLEHQPLPDTLGYRNLSKIAEHRDSDIVVKPYAISWKGYGAAGPTCCTKMRVHRPKTCDVKKQDGDKDDRVRPTTSMPDLGGQYKKPMSLMDLAICWDFRPDDPKVEPRPSKHIDGSNGSRAPAVFTMIYTPKDDEEPGRLGHTNPIFNQNQTTVNDPGHHPVPYFEKDMTKEKPKDSCDVQYCPQHDKTRNGSAKNCVPTPRKPSCDGIHGCGTPSDGSRSAKDNRRPGQLQPIKDAWTNQPSDNDAKYRNRGSLESYEKTSLAQGKLHQSSPSESHSSRRSTKDSLAANNNGKHKTCLPCNSSKTSEDVKPKEQYKSAFKAGNPNSIQSSSNGSKDSKGFKIPKMRHPYSKKNYTIPTLSPPFTIWKDANATGYPEHWRLASVYQHAYKPPEQRRKPLISSVYQ